MGTSIVFTGTDAAICVWDTFWGSLVRTSFEERNVAQRVAFGNGLHCRFFEQRQCIRYVHTQTTEQREPLQLIHWNLKPTHLLLSAQGEVKIVDFGITKTSTHESETKEGLVRSLSPYLAPEQILAHPLDLRMDLYALGVVLFELCCGKPPFVSSDLFALIRAIREQDPPSPRQCTPDIPEDLGDLILQMLHKNPDLRPQTADEVQQKLTKILMQKHIHIDREDLASFYASLT